MKNENKPSTNNTNTGFFHNNMETGVKSKSPPSQVQEGMNTKPAELFSRSMTNNSSEAFYSSESIYNIIMNGGNTLSPKSFTNTNNLQSASTKAISLMSSMTSSMSAAGAMGGMYPVAEKMSTHVINKMQQQEVSQRHNQRPMAANKVQGDSKNSVANVVLSQHKQMPPSTDVVVKNVDLPDLEDVNICSHLLQPVLGNYSVSEMVNEYEVLNYVFTDINSNEGSLTPQNKTSKGLASKPQTPVSTTSLEQGKNFSTTNQQKPSPATFPNPNASKNIQFSSLSPPNINKVGPIASTLKQMAQAHEYQTSQQYGARPQQDQFGPDFGRAGANPLARSGGLVNGAAGSPTLPFPANSSGNRYNGQAKTDCFKQKFNPKTPKAPTQQDSNGSATKQQHNEVPSSMVATASPLNSRLAIRGGAEMPHPMNSAGTTRGGNSPQSILGEYKTVMSANSLKANSQQKQQQQQNAPAALAQSPLQQYPEHPMSNQQQQDHRMYQIKPPHQLPLAQRIHAAVTHGPRPPYYGDVSASALSDFTNFYLINCPCEAA